MDSQSPETSGKEQRILAAIVFTDVVGFSKLTAQNEGRVYTALQRDMGIISSLCRAHSGQVLNTMGDGMLLCFTSAVDAMSCAVEIQRTLFSQAATIPASDVLHHRIGVHLGDIIMSADNVFGDGVNIAARLQAEAKPDGICFSKTVYDVIKNKLKIDAQYMAPRQLKNVGKVEMWQVPPIEEARQKVVNELVTAPLEIKPEPTGVGGYKAIGLTVAVVALLAVVGVLMRSAYKGIPAAAKPGTVMTNPNAGVKAWANKARELKAKANGTDVPASDTTPAVATNPQSNATAPGAPSNADLQAKLDGFKTQLAFDQAAAFLQGEGKTLPNAQALAQTFTDLSDMKKWMDAEVDSATASNTITCSVPVSGTPTEVKIYRSPNGQGYTVEQPSGTQVVQFQQFGAMGISAIAQALASHPITNPNPKAATWVSEMQQVYTSP